MVRKYGFLICVAIVFVVGCETIRIVDPQSAEVETAYRVDPNTAATIDAIGGAVVTSTGAASAIWPAVMPIAGVAAGAFGVWRKIKPKLTEATRRNELGEKAGETLAEALEEVKQKHPSVWADVKPIIEKAAKPATEIENAIRGFRNLEPRVS